MDDYLDMTRDFEIKKKKNTNDKKNENEKKCHVVIRFPLTLKELFEKETGEDLQTCIEQKRHVGQVELDRDKLKVNERIMRSFFEEPIRRIVDHVNMLFTKPDVMDVPHILMIGGFSDSKMLQYAIQKEFGRRHVTVTVPHEPGVVVLKGAVVFGHDTGAISARIAKYTYGVAKRMNFIEGKHDERHKIIDDDGIIRCKDLFGKFVEIGESLKCKESFQYEYKSPDSKCNSFEV
ncbi:hypothetical protein CHS0354_009515 [Potamilus streckersoni]|uniref:Heat shock protein 70 n=1 Tax=Potamilus streckersoni TaxID=2493646 RepID=A0AAE0VJG0_9BIVA|nr:hypothetical protein CHS0354_009515 [Potamilus streckersoni]